MEFPGYELNIGKIPIGLPHVYLDSEDEGLDETGNLKILPPID